MDWQLVVTLITLALVLFSLLFGNNLWARREKVRTKNGGLNFGIVIVDYSGRRVLKVYWGTEFQRLGGKEIRYTKKILLKPDEQTCNQLRRYFKLPDNGEIEIKERLELPKAKIVPSGYGGEPIYPEYEALSGIQDSEWDTAQQIAKDLSQLDYEVRLVWDDGGKTKWKTISKENYGRWVDL